MERQLLLFWMLIALAAYHDDDVHQRDCRQNRNNRDEDRFVDLGERDRARRADHEAEGRQYEP